MHRTTEQIVVHQFAYCRNDDNSGSSLKVAVKNFPEKFLIWSPHPLPPYPPTPRASASKLSRRFSLIIQIPGGQETAYNFHGKFAKKVQRKRLRIADIFDNNLRFDSLGSIKLDACELSTGSRESNFTSTFRYPVFAMH